MKLSEKRRARVRELRDAVLEIFDGGGGQPKIFHVGVGFIETTIGELELRHSYSTGEQIVSVWSPSSKVLGVNWSGSHDLYATCYKPGDWETTILAESRAPIRQRPALHVDEGNNWITELLSLPRHPPEIALILKGTREVAKGSESAAIAEARAIVDDKRKVISDIGEPPTAADLSAALKASWLGHHREVFGGSGR